VATEAVTPATGMPSHRTCEYLRITLLQSFEGGGIFWRSETGPIAVSGAIFETISSDPVLRRKIGYPVSEERPLILASPIGFSFSRMET
jgi:hypothetical protein